MGVFHGTLLLTMTPGMLHVTSVSVNTPMLRKPLSRYTRLLLHATPVLGTLFLIGLEGKVAAQTIGPNLNLSKLPGNQYETSVAINPNDNNQIFVAARNETGGILTARSSDGGATWTSRLMATVTVPQPGDLPRAYGNVSVSWDKFGNLFVVYLSQGTVNSPATYVTLALSKDGGATFYSPTGSGPAVILPNPTTPIVGDQPTVVTGAGSGGFAGSVWVTYFSNGGIWVSGAGVSGLGVVGPFASQPLPSQPVGVNFGDIAVGPNGEVMVTYGPNSGSSGGIYTNVDSDGLGPNAFSAYTLATPVNLGGFSYIPAQPNWGIDPEAGLAWDTSTGPHRGRVYLVYTDAPNVGSYDTNIYLRYSDNQGATWSAPVRVNDDTGLNSQFLPHLSLDASNGMIAVTWYDARNSAANETAQYFGAFSTDSGVSFGGNFQISTGVSNQALSIAALRKADFGDYTSNAFVNGRLVPAWADNSNSTADNPDGATNFDVYTGVVAAPTPAPACGAANATITFVNKWWLDVVIRAGDPVTHVVYTSTPGATTFAGVTGFAVGELVDYTGTLDAVGMCHAISMTVKPPPAPISIGPSVLPVATIGLAYSAAITSSGGLAPTSITGVSGLPAGLAWNGTAIAGTPLLLGTSSLTITAKDGRGVVQTATLSLTVKLAGSYSIQDQGQGAITSLGDHYLFVGSKMIIWDASTKFKLNGAAQIAVGMQVKWKGKRDAVSGVVLANQLEIN